MRFNLRVKIRNLTLFLMVAKTQTLEGVTSRTFDKKGEPDGMHLPMWDLENCTLEQALDSLKHVQNKYNLGNIFVTSDKEGSYRAWCYTKVPFNQLIHILTDTEHLDYSFLFYTFKRKRATLRSSSKKDRQPQKIVHILRTYPDVFPEVRERVFYDTGMEKKGKTVLIGEKLGAD